MARPTAHQMSADAGLANFVARINAKHSAFPWHAQESKPDGACWNALIVAQDRLSKLDIAPAQAAGRTKEECDANAAIITAAAEALTLLSAFIKAANEQNLGTVLWPESRQTLQGSRALLKRLGVPQ